MRQHTSQKGKRHATATTQNRDEDMIFTGLSLFKLAPWQPREDFQKESRVSSEKVCLQLSSLRVQSELLCTEGVNARVHTGV